MRYALYMHYAVEISSPAIHKDLPLDGSDLSIRYSNVVFACGYILVENTIAVGFRQCILEFGMRFTSIRIYIQLAIYLTFFRISAGIAQSVLLKFFPRLLKLPRFFVTYKKMYYEMHTVTLLRRYFARVSTIFSNLKFCISGFYIVRLECKLWNAF